MQRLRLADQPWIEIHSPTKKFHSFCRNLSLALGGVRNTGPEGGGHPFDLQIRRLPPGAAVCPFHSHFAQWELFVVLAGVGTVRTTEARTAVTAGDAFVHPPGAPHQLINTGPTDLEVLILADNPPMDAGHYPDSDKWYLRPPGKIFRLTETDYFDGEDTLPATGNSGYKLNVSPLPAVAPFAARKVSLANLPWETWTSPKKKFAGASKEISLALGAKRNTPTGRGGHPFDLELSRLAPGECGCPFHAHAAQWELFYIVSGSATVRAGAETHRLHAGELVLHPPGEPHQITNASATDELEFYLVADNPPVDYWHYPDSGKWGLREPRKFFRMNEAEYWDGEE
ncbi:MAG: hypothetical protein RLZZ15_396 [Verrucomicrobiota bacterium]|jgi:uncharacterized cupin superfamily protein